ncbi:MAG: FtsK/SpoIIIE domain-containing protein [Mycoplasmoidaceae bacterium]
MPEIQKVDTQQVIQRLSDADSNIKPTNNKETEIQHHRRVMAIWKTIGKVALLLWTVLALARVPFIGSYVDGLLDYLLGFTKYLFYPLTIFVLVGWIFNTGYTRVVMTKRFIFFSLLGLLSAGCIVSGITGMIDAFHKPLAFSEIMANYHGAWLSFFKNWHYSGFFNHYVTGGILAELIAYVFAFLSFVVLIIVAAVILVVTIFIIFNINYKSTRIGLRLRSWMVRKLGGSFKYDGYNELKAKRDNQNKFKKNKKIDIEALASQNSSLPFDLLPETDLNKYDGNFKHARYVHNRLATLFRNSNIDCVPTDINIYSSYCEVCFEAKNKHEVQEIIKMQPRIAKVAKLDHFNISVRGNIVNFEIDNAYFSKYSLRTACNLYTAGKDVTAIIGLDKNAELVTQNYRNTPSSLIIGKKGSGSATLAVLMALSTCYITTPDDLELVVLNPNCEATYSAFNNIPHTNNKSYESVNACTEKLHDLQTVVNERNSLLKVNNVTNIDQYNKISKNQTKFQHILVIISNVDILLKDTFQNNKIIADILQNGREAGVYLVMQSYRVYNDVIDKSIYSNVASKYILTLESQEESLKIFDNYRGYQLHGNGDCLYFANDKLSGMKRIQICNLNYVELTTIIDTIKTFYATKLKQKEEKLLQEAEHEQNK